MPKDSFEGWLSEMLKTDDKEERIQKMFIELMGWTSEQATKWFDTPNDELGGQSPQEVMNEGNSGIDTVYDLIIDMVTGNPA